MLVALVVALAAGQAWAVRLGAAVLVLGGFLLLAALRYRRLSPALRRLVRQNRFAVPLGAIQVVTVPAIGLAWGSRYAVLLNPLLIVACGVGIIQLRNRVVLRIGRTWRRSRYRWTVTRPVERAG